MGDAGRWLAASPSWSVTTPTLSPTTKGVIHYSKDGAQIVSVTPMNDHHDTRRCEVLLSLQRALLGEVTPRLRAVTVRHAESSIHFDAYFDGEPNEEERESMSAVETEVMAGFPATHTTTHDVIRLDPPALIPKDRIWVYFRKELSVADSRRAP